MTWSCNAKANVPLQDAEDHEGQRPAPAAGGLRVGDDQILHNIKKGLRTDIARRFTEDCRKLGITIHGTFILGLPGETKETIEKTIEFAKEINPHTIQVSLAAPYPGTSLYKQAVENGWLQENDAVNLVNDKGVQLALISYPHLSKEDIFPRRGEVLQALLFPPVEDLGNRQGNADELGHDEAPSARRRGVLPLPARARGLIF
jgi:radical SAM superfamily enzyme YgiQ (UPF0313 family)